MRSPRDSFLHFLADNLPSLSIHPIRRDPDDPATGTLQVEAINVGFGRLDLGITVSSIFAKIDVISTSELTATDMMQQVWLLLAAKFYTPLLDYTDPQNPVQMGTMLMWKRCRFVPVDNDAYFQFSCTLPLQFHNVLPPQS